ncbi:hypothetical protein L6R52_43945, partial [Myxococcota bacterium]|nr:hypothetical protein [Myxococcota bacterium]
MTDIDQLRADVAARPDDALGWARLARALAEVEDREGAREALRPAMALPSASADAWVEIGFVHELLQDPQRAAVAYRKAISIDRRAVEAHRAHATLLIRAGDLRAATLVLRAAVASAPDAHELHLLLAHALERTAQLAD